MDPLTHTLVGANLAASPLGRTTRLAAAALVIGANLPDVDSILYFTGHDDLALWFRRGWTHGVLAMAVLPVVLTGLLLLYDRLRPDPRRRLNPSWILMLSFLAILTHPALDWLNDYGMRWLMPFRGTWSYGDSVFIMDPWLWLILGLGALMGRRPTRSLMVLFVAIAIWIGNTVYQRSPAYLIVVGIVSIALFAAMFVRRPRGIATMALVAASVYIGARLTIHEVTERRVGRELGRPERLMVAPHPIDPTRWDIVAQTGDVYRYGRFTWRNQRLEIAPEVIPVAKESPEYAAARRDPSIRGFVNWMRFPWYEIERSPGETRVLIHDARYALRRRPGGGWGGVEVVLPK